MDDTKGGGQGSNAGQAPNDLMQENQKLRAALEGAYQRIGELRSVITRVAPDEPLPSADAPFTPAIPAGRSGWWERAGVAQEGSAQAPDAEVPSYFGMEGVWVPGKVAEVENLDEVLSEMDLEETYAKVNAPPR